MLIDQLSTYEYNTKPTLCKQPLMRIKPSLQIQEKKELNLIVFTNNYKLEKKV